MPGIMGRTKPTIDPRKPVSANVDQSSLVKKICIVAPSSLSYVQYTENIRK